PPQDCGRFWNGASSANGGSFVEWNFNLLASGLSPAIWNATSGHWESESRATAVTGSFFGIFHDVTTNEYYRGEWDVNLTSWAHENGLIDSPFYAANDRIPTETVPEP